ncbi:MAG: sulfite exporter TauE/SafE family protein [Oscillospiraceae bacterium]|jgi:sulfite exporter TauE/SafE/copper chaperone CopZ/plastocyanin domain-containing protein|nr:sulfite exporter TauE/SafE family protein [Oscillospiraceae bacterium]
MIDKNKMWGRAAMESGIITQKLRIGGMSCTACQAKIEKKLRETPGVVSVFVSYSAEKATVSYDAGIVTLRELEAIIERLGYRVLHTDGRQKANLMRVIGTLVIIVCLYVLLQQFGILNLLVPTQLADSTAGYGMLFVIGLITSIHCIAMCGGINLSQCLPQQTDAVQAPPSRTAAFMPAFLYNLGRVISYTVIGFILGFAGMLFGGEGAGLPVLAQGILKLIAGVFMVIMGINMLGIFPWLRKLNLRMPKVFSKKVGATSAKSKSPLIVGLLNGLMPCGPLQAMQLVALASGNPFTGAVSMLLFSLGTVPLMLGLGAAVSALGKKFTQKTMTVGAVLVVVLGLAMLSQGGSLSGLLPPQLLLPVILALCAVGIVSVLPFRKKAYKTASTAAAFAAAVLLLVTWSSLGSSYSLRSVQSGGSAPESGIVLEDGKQVINSTLTSGKYPNITVQAGTPVKWVINAPKGSINGCNNRMLINDYGIEYSFKTGENVIEFTPAKAGTVRYNCWMGMIRGTITVLAAGSAEDNGGASDYDGTTPLPDDGETDFAGVPANIKIPTEKLAVAEFGTVTENGVEYEIQRVRIELTDDGYGPAIIVVQAGLTVEWTIAVNASGGSNLVLLAPIYYSALDLTPGENALYLFPTADFEFSNGDNTFYGYVKVVADITAIDEDAIRAEVAAYETMIYPPQMFDGGTDNG